MSRFVLGTVQFGLDYGINNSGGKPTESSTFAILDFAHKNGITTLDTAPVYGNAELLIGRYQEAAKKEFSVNTKFSLEGTSVKRSLENSCLALHVENINVLFYHRYNDLSEYPSVLEELVTLKQEGSINGIGVSVYDNEQFKRSIDKTNIDLIQLPFNLLDNASKRQTLMNEAIAAGKRLQVRSAFLQGLFFKEENTWPVYLEPLKKYNQHIRQLADQNGLTVYEMALSYVLSKHQVNELVIGVDNKEQLKLNLAIESKKISSTLAAAIDDIDVKEVQLLYPYNWK